MFGQQGSTSACDLPMQALSRVKSLVMGSGTSGVYSMGCGSEGSGSMGSCLQAARHKVKNNPTKSSMC